MTALLTSDPSLIRTYISDQEAIISDNGTTGTTTTLLESIIHGIVDEEELGIQDSLTDVLKTILDPSVMMDKKETLQKMFYSDRAMNILMSPFVTPEKYSTSSKIHVLDIFSFTVQNHAYMSKRFITNNNILKKVLKLLESEDQKDLILGKLFGVTLFLHTLLLKQIIANHKSLFIFLLIYVRYSNHTVLQGLHFAT